MDDRIYSNWRGQWFVVEITTTETWHLTRSISQLAALWREDNDSAVVVFDSFCNRTLMRFADTLWDAHAVIFDTRFVLNWLSFLCFLSVFTFAFIQLLIFYFVTSLRLIEVLNTIRQMSLDSVVSYTIDLGKNQNLRLENSDWIYSYFSDTQRKYRLHYYCLWEHEVLSSCINHMQFGCL